MTEFGLSKPDLDWKVAITGGFLRSYYGLLAIIFNALGLVSFLRLEGVFRPSPASPAVRILMAIVFIVSEIGLNVYVWQLCRSTGRALSGLSTGSANEKAILGYSRKAFRMYLLGLFAFFVASTLAVN
jgi:hypothetical protein